MSKGSKRRPAQIDDATEVENWARTFRNVGKSNMNLIAAGAALGVDLAPACFRCGMPMSALRPGPGQRGWHCVNLDCVARYYVQDFEPARK